MFRDGSARLLVFRLGAELYGVDVQRVGEVIDLPAVQRIPDVSATVLGVASVRGTLVTIYDARAVLQLSQHSTSAALLFDCGAGRVGLAVSDVVDTVAVTEEAMRPAPAAAAGDGLLLGIVRRGANLIAVLDADALLTAAGADGEGGARED